MSSYSGFVAYWEEYKRTFPMQRPGQALFNAASMYSNETCDLATAVVGTSFDPYHNDNEISKFLEYIRNGLDKSA
jgi:hypothetical protein